MIRLSSQRARLGRASAVMLMLAALSANPVAADTGPVGDGTYTQVGTQADVSSGNCTSNGDGTTTCSQVELSIFAGKMSDDVSGVTHSRGACVYLATTTYDDETGNTVDALDYEAGCVDDLSKKSLAIDPQLMSATLATTAISIQRFTCEDKGEGCVPGAIRTVDVGGTWTGLGAIYSTKERTRNDDGSCRYAQSFSGSSRDAGFRGSVDGSPLVDDVSAWLQDGKMTFRSRCVEV